MNKFNIGLFDEDGDLRYVFPTFDLAKHRQRILGWGKIYKIQIEYEKEKVLK